MEVDVVNKQIFYQLPGQITPVPHLDRGMEFCIHAADFRRRNPPTDRNRLMNSSWHLFQS